MSRKFCRYNEPTRNSRGFSFAHWEKIHSELVLMLLYSLLIAMRPLESLMFDI